MPRVLSSLCLSALVAACAGSGVVRTAPVAWPAGTYYLEGAVTYTSGFGERREVYSADLYVESDGTMRLDNHLGGVCQDPTPQQLRRDEEGRRRTFTCGTVGYVLRPNGESVTGELLAVVSEDHETTRCVYTQGGVCAQTTRVQETRSVRKEAVLRVQRVD